MGTVRVLGPGSSADSLRGGSLGAGGDLVLGGGSTPFNGSELLIDCDRRWGTDGRAVFASSRLGGKGGSSVSPHAGARRGLVLESTDDAEMLACDVLRDDGSPEGLRGGRAGAGCVDDLRVGKGGGGAGALARSVVMLAGWLPMDALSRTDPLTLHGGLLTVLLRMASGRDDGGIAGLRPTWFWFKAAILSLIERTCVSSAMTDPFHRSKNSVRTNEPRAQRRRSLSSGDHHKEQSRRSSSQYLCIVRVTRLRDRGHRPLSLFMPSL